MPFDPKASDRARALATVPEAETEAETVARVTGTVRTAALAALADEASPPREE